MFRHWSQWPFGREKIVSCYSFVRRYPRIVNSVNAAIVRAENGEHAIPALFFFYVQNKIKNISNM